MSLFLDPLCEKCGFSSVWIQFCILDFQLEVLLENKSLPCLLSYGCLHSVINSALPRHGTGRLLRLSASVSSLPSHQHTRNYWEEEPPEWTGLADTGSSGTLTREAIDGLKDYGYSLRRKPRLLWIRPHGQ